MIGTPFKEIFNKDDKASNLISGAELIKSELEFLLTIEKHSLFFGNDLGIDLDRYLYLLNKTATFNLIKSDLEELFAKYNRVYLIKVDMSFERTGKATIDLVVSQNRDGTQSFTKRIGIGE